MACQWAGASTVHSIEPVQRIDVDIPKQVVATVTAPQGTHGPSNTAIPQLTEADRRIH